MLSPIPVFWRSAAGGLFLLAFLPVASHAQVAAKAPSPTQIQKLGNAAAAKLLIHVEKPEYPSIAKVNFVQGTVTLEIKVSSKGQVCEAHVIKGEPILAAAALKSVRKWLYRPYISLDGPAPFSTEVVVKFDLHPHHYRGQLPQDANDYLKKQVRPPEVISHPQQDQSPVGIRMRVLVDSEGRVMDAVPSQAGGPGIGMARKSLESWKFRPARWGAIAVPWYVTVTVPLPYEALDQTANSAKH